MDKLCSNPSCGSEAALFCSGCRLVRYCSKEHQIEDWKEHKLNCKAYREEFDIQDGKHLVANRDLKPGDIIFEEAPFFLWLFPEEDAFGPKTACVGCCSILNERAGVKKCRKCNWPRCENEACWAEIEGVQHALGECTLLPTQPLVELPEDVKDKESAASAVMYYSIAILRCLSLRDQNPKKWEKLMELQDREPVHLIGSESLTINDEAIVDLVKFTMTSSSDSQPVTRSAPDEVIRKVFRIVYVHSRRLWNNPTNGKSENAHGLYQVGSLIEHNCVPNSWHSINDDGKLIVRAAISIPKGGRITQNLQHAEPFAGTLTRRTAIATTKYIHCYCERCKDPTELGTFISGIYCPKCPKQFGILLREDPMKYDHEHNGWVCNKCSYRSTDCQEDYVIKTVKTLLQLITELEHKSADECEAIICNFSDILHPHHSLMIWAKIRICKWYTQSGTATDEILDRLILMSREILQLADIVSPGLNSLRKEWLTYKHTYLEIKITILKRRDCNYSEIEQIALLDAEKIEAKKELLVILSLLPDASSIVKSFERLCSRIKLN